ncbi:MAG: alpha-amylase family glycosyl hydrolase [Roseburia sp.]|nr:alpha-amylase family glycosyl hydrolase [Roseburia sp.]MCM1278190.1 alpha-amylase family glycosyl hydrolase [Robinsoniella sp.]
MKKKIISIVLILHILILGGCGKNPTASSMERKVNTQGISDNYRTFYEVFVYSFYDSDGDGIGDIKGLTGKLDYINDGDDSTDSDMGFSGIWLMPIMPSTTYHKYDVMNYYDIDEEYGTLDDFRAFMAECDKRNINVILDLVMNHTSSQHPWFLEACEYLKGLDGKEPDSNECKYVDYYYFTTEKKSEVYYPVEGTDWYYEGKFWSEMPDLNLENENVRQEFTDICKFWLDMGVAGFRLDAAKEYVSDNVSANVEILSWFNRMVKAEKEDAYIVAEVWTDADTYAKYYESGIDSVFNFSFANNEGIIAKTIKGGNDSYTPKTYGQAVEKCKERFSQYNENYIDAPFYTNHDMGRSAGYYSGEYSESQTKIAASMNLFMSGTAFVYYGEELGMKGSGEDEKKRAPMLWSLDKGKEGMCKGPEGSDTVKMKYDSLEEQMENKNSIYQYYKEAIRIRNSYPEIVKGDTSLVEEISNDRICALLKSYESEAEGQEAAETKEVLVIFNISSEEAEVDLSNISLNGKELDSKALRDSLLTGEAEAALEGMKLSMPAYSVVILE